MSARNLWIVAGMLVALGVGAFLLLRGDDKARSAHPDGASGASSSSTSGAGDTRTDPGHPATLQPRRTIPVAPIGPGTGTSPDLPQPAPAGTPLETAFDGEARDDAWATATEAVLRPRLAAIADTTHTRIVSIECRSRQCRVRIEGTADDTGAALTRLGEDNGLVGVATQMIATAPETLPDGGMRLDVFGQFDR